MEDVLYPSNYGQLQLVCYLPHSSNDPVWPIEARLELLGPLLLQHGLSARLKAKVNQVPHIKLHLHTASVCVHLLLILGCHQVILESPKNVLALLDLVFGLGGLASSKHHISKSQCIITIQIIKWRHTNRHVECRVVAVFPQVQPTQPSLMLSCDIVPQVSLQPLVRYLGLPISLWVVACAGC